MHQAEILSLAKNKMGGEFECQIECVEQRTYRNESEFFFKLRNSIKKGGGGQNFIRLKFRLEQ